MGNQYKEYYLILPSENDERADTKEAIQFNEDEIKEYISQGYYLINKAEYNRLLGNSGKEYLISHITGDLYEKPSVPFENLKFAKLAEVDNWTADKITGGFISQCTGSPVRYDSDRDTQNTVSSDLNTIYLSPEKFNENFPNGYPMRGYPENANIKQVYFLTKEQLLQWNVDLGLHRGTCKQNGWIKQAEVNAAQSKEELDAIILD